MIKLQRNLLKYFSRGKEHFRSILRETINIPFSKSYFDPLIYSIENPKYHLFKTNKINTFSGWVFYFGPKTVKKINVYYDTKFVNSFSVNLKRDDVAIYVPSLASAKHCGFQHELVCPENIKNIHFEIVYDDDSISPFFDYNITYIAKCQHQFKKWMEMLNNMSMPDENTVFLTQGHFNVEEYKNSILPATLNLIDYLRASNTYIKKIKNVLDFGCGTGRILKGLHSIHPEWNLYGCDYNKVFIDWNRRHLPKELSFYRNELKPPLEYPDNQFYFIYAISVFTHLTLDNQHKWISEFKRILNQGGVLLITLQGEFYVRNFFNDQSEKIQEFLERGYFTTTEYNEIEGENKFGAFHAPFFVQEFFADFDLVGFFPQGNMSNKRNIFQIALAQDVYVFRLRVK